MSALPYLTHSQCSTTLAEQAPSARPFPLVLMTLVFVFPRARSVFEKDGAQVVVDESSLTLLAGSTVDYEDEMMKSAFVVTDNPQSAQGCGCGTSFSVEI